MKYKLESQVHYSTSKPEKAPEHPIDRYLWEMDKGCNNTLNLRSREETAWRKLKEFLGMHPYKKASPR